MARLYTYREVREELGLRHPQTVADLVRVFNLTPKPIPLNGNAKGLDEADLELLRDRLGLAPALATA